MLQKILRYKTILALLAMFGFAKTGLSQISISGPTCVVAGNSYLYSFSGSYNGSTAMTWCVSNGVIQQAYGSNITGSSTCKSGDAVGMISVMWTAPSNGSVTLESSNGNASPLGITIVSPLSGGSITTNVSQTIGYNSVPADIICSTAMYGTCSPNYNYQWQQSTDNVTWADMSQTTQNLSFSFSLLNTTYYRRKVTETNTSAVNYSDNYATVFVTPPFSTVTITAATQDIYTATTPGEISGPAASGGNCGGNYTYQWEFSTDGNIFNNVTNGSGANTVAYTPAPLSVTTYFRRKDMCGTGTSAQYSYSNALKINVYPHLVAGTISLEGPSTITYNTYPGSFTRTDAAGGMCSYINAQWQQSTDGINYIDAGPGYYNWYSSGNLLATTYFRVRYLCGETAYSNVITVFVNAQVFPGTIPIENLNVPTNVSPGPITASTASGGNCSNNFVYTWQQSPDGQYNTFTDIAGANGLNYTPPALSATTWYRRKVTCGIDVLFTNSCTVYVVNTSSYNYIRARDITKPNVTLEADAAPLTDPHDVKQTTQYFDALGRLDQTVSRQASPLLKDMVVPNIYDPFGRELIKHMPYVATTNDGLYKSSAIADQNTFNNNQFPGEQFFYSRTDYEASPLNLTLGSYAPGNSWNGNNRGTTMQYWSNTATDAVKIFTITDVGPAYSLSDFSSAPAYIAGSLNKTVAADENGKQVIEFQDLQGRVVLKKVQLTASADNGTGSGFAGWLSTYYVYDIFNNLRLVIPPKAVELFQAGTSLTGIADELCFRYEYDDRNRMIIKKVPGAGEVYMVNDKRDRPVFTQDANMRLQNQWMTTLYDGMNRPLMTGMITYSGTRDALQTFVNLNTGTGTGSGITVASPVVTNLNINQREPGRTEYKATGSITFNPEFATEAGAEFTALIDPNAVSGNENIGVTDNPLPAGNNFIALTITYYDNYDWTSQTYDNTAGSKLSAGANFYAEGFPGNATQQTVISRGLVTGTKIRVLEDPSNLAKGIFLSTASFYDYKGRGIQVKADNYKNGSDITSNLYDFSGKVLSSYAIHNNPAATPSKTGVRTSMEYDAAGRMLTTEKAVFDNDGGNASTTVIIAKNEYNELGQLKRKTLEPAYNSNAGLEKQDYDYNIRGWLLGMNRGYARDDNNSNYFGFDLGYDKTSNNLIGGQQYANAQYNGNITGTVWKSKGDQEKRKYDFSYDAANRLTAANFNQFTDNGFNKNAGMDFSVINLNYDANGNILTMNQMGRKVSGSSMIDQLTYSYQPNGNKLLNVTDGMNDETTILGDFRRSALHPQNANDYDYDVNGNLTKDLNKDIGNATTNGIIYNHLNLPWQIAVKNASGNKGTITYIYDATGSKLQKRVSENASSTNGNIARTSTTDYIGSFLYENNALQFLNQEEGRIRKTTIVSTGLKQYVFDYMLKDHLGNVRSLITDEVNSNFYPAASMETPTRDDEKRYYSKIDETSFPISQIPGYPYDDWIEPNEQVAKLNGQGNSIGPGIVLKVMAGDKFNVTVSSWYKQNGALNGPVGNPLPDLIANLVAGIGGVTGNHGMTSQLQDGTVLTPGFLDFFDRKDNYTSLSRPLAYVNWILFDDQFKLVANSSGAEQVPDQSAFIKHYQSYDDDVVYRHIKNNLPINKNGYLYVYLDNSTPNVDVFFDNFQVTHIRGPLLEETHYYPFGLQIAGISSKALAFGGGENKYKYNKGSELQNKEFGDGSGLEMYDTHFRQLDPQLGRWWQIDPKPDFAQSLYSAMGNNPISNNDPLGDSLLNRSDQRIANRIERQINSTNTRLNKQATNLNGKIADAQAKGNIGKVNRLSADLKDVNSRISSNTTSLTRLNAIRGDQKMAYTFNQLPSGSTEGGTKLGAVKNSSGEMQVAVVMSIVGDANAVHEMTHAYQGRIEGSITLDGSGASFPGNTLFAQQMSNSVSEIEAYKAQYGFDPSGMPPSTMGGVPQSMSAINAPYVGGINTPNSTTPLYPNVRNMVNTIMQFIGLF